MPTLSIDGFTLGFDAVGSGPNVILIHGSPGQAKVWSKVTERLSARHRVIAPNLPGYGGTSPQPEGEAPDIAFACRLIEALIEAEGPPAVIAGHSYGAAVALRIALRAKVCPGALALFEPVTLPILQLAGDQQAYDNAQTLLGDYIARFARGEPQCIRLMVDFWFGDGTFAGMPSPIASYLEGETRSNVRDVQSTFRETYSIEALQALAMPVTVLVGDRSPVTTHRIATTIARHTLRGEMRTIVGTNHAMVTTHPDAVAEAIASLSD